VEKLEEVGHPKSETTIRRQIKSFDALRRNRNINEYTFICKDFFLYAFIRTLALDRKLRPESVHYDKTKSAFELKKLQLKTCGTILSLKRSQFTQIKNNQTIIYNFCESLNILLTSHCFFHHYLSA